MLRDLGHEIVPVELPSTKHALSSYYIIAPAEASSNLAKYDGVRFGPRRPRHPPGTESKRFSALDGFVAARDAGFGKEVKRRILLGNYSLSSEAMENYFIQAQKIRRIVKEDFDNVFAMPNLLDSREVRNPDNQEGVDVLISPTSVSPAPKLEEVGSSKASIDDYINDVFTVPASMAGLPAMSVPVGTDGELPVGLQITAQYGDEDSLFQVGTLIESLQEN
ncbi:hypothetical protein ABW19_dt0210116 [Dactylella cylindrospora]|nr:hypothetical protein ABW19_dt0210116 [Dactylella cylindrospora]